MGESIFFESQSLPGKDAAFAHDYTSALLGVAMKEDIEKDFGPLFFLKDGSVEMTARWVAEGYTYIKQHNPQMNHIEILQKLTEIRYSDQEEFEYPRSKECKESIHWFLTEQNDISKGLVDFLMWLICKELCINDFPFENYAILRQELQNYGFSDAVLGIGKS